MQHQEGLPPSRNICACRVTTFRCYTKRARDKKEGIEYEQKEIERTEQEGVGAWDMLGNERVRPSIAEHREEEAHLIRVQGTNYFPILWPAKI